MRCQLFVSYQKACPTIPGAVMFSANTAEGEYRTITNMRKDISSNNLADFINAVSSCFKYGIRQIINFKNLYRTE